MFFISGREYSISGKISGFKNQLKKGLLDFSKPMVVEGPWPL